MLNSKHITAILVVISVLGIYIPVTNTYATTIPLSQHNYTPNVNNRITFQQDFNITLPTNFTSDLIEAFLDAFWDYDNDNGGGGLLTVIWSFSPFGENAATTYTFLVIFSFAGGAIILAKKRGISLESMMRR